MTQYVGMPLYDSFDYEYPINMEGSSYIFRVYFNERLKQWFYDLIADSGEKLISGRRLTLQGTSWVAEVQELNGCLYLEPIGLEINETMANYDKLFKYFKLHYLFN